MDLSPREEATALKVLIRERGWSARQVASAIQRSQALRLQAFRVFEDPTLAPVALAHELTLGWPIFATEDAKEGARAFKDKRPANFQGR